MSSTRPEEMNVGKFVKPSEFAMPCTAFDV
jgi:hypothetical protein